MILTMAVPPFLRIQKYPRPLLRLVRRMRCRFCCHCHQIGKHSVLVPQTNRCLRSSASHGGRSACRIRRASSAVHHSLKLSVCGDHDLVRDQQFEIVGNHGVESDHVRKRNVRSRLKDEVSSHDPGIGAPVSVDFLRDVGSQISTNERTT